MEPKASQSALEWVLDHALAAAGLLALVIYGVARAGVDGFYSQVHVTPEEVGLNQTIVTGRAALWFALVLTLSIAVGATLTATISVRIKALRRRSATRSGHPYDDSSDTGWRISLGILFVVALGIPFAVLNSRTPYAAVFKVSRVLGFWLVVYFGVLVGLAAWFVRVEHQRAIASLQKEWRSVLNSNRNLPPSDERVPYLLWREAGGGGPSDSAGQTTASGLSTEGKMVLIAILAAGAFLSMGLARTIGKYDARYVIFGYGYDPNRSGLAVRGDPVCLAWPTDAQPISSAGPYMYLGENNDTLVLFDYVKPGHPQGIPIRIPSSGVTMTIAGFRPEDPGNIWACSAS